MSQRNHLEVGGDEWWFQCTLHKKMTASKNPHTVQRASSGLQENKISKKGTKHYKPLDTMRHEVTKHSIKLGK